MKTVVLLFEPRSGYQHHVLTGIRQYLQTGIDWKWAGIMPNNAALSALRKLRPDGVIGMILTQEMAAAIKRMHIPSVNVSGVLVHTSGARVTVDHFQVGTMATEYFVEKKFKSFGFLGIIGNHFAMERQRGLEAGLGRHQFQCSCRLINDVENIHELLPSWSQVKPELANWLRSLPKPAAILACNDKYGLILVSTCHALGLHIPDDVAILGVDDDELMCTLAQPQLSSVGLPAVRIGYEAAQLLDQLLKKSSAAKSNSEILLPPTGIVTRASTDVLSIGDPDVLSAVRYIREHVRDMLDIANIADQLCVSRRALEYKFTRALGHGIQEEIRRARVAAARRLLAESDLSVSQVASRAGFATRAHFFVVFRHYAGTSPGAYRRLFRGG